MQSGGVISTPRRTNIEARKEHGTGTFQVTKQRRRQPTIQVPLHSALQYRRSRLLNKILAGPNTGPFFKRRGRQGLRRGAQRRVWACLCENLCALCVKANGVVAAPPRCVSASRSAKIFGEACRAKNAKAVKEHFLVAGPSLPSRPSREPGWGCGSALRLYYWFVRKRACMAASQAGQLAPKSSAR